MLRLLLTPRWLARHALALLLVGGCVVAARWQYHRAVEHHNSLQNWSYVVTWLLFAGFVVLCWGWYLRDEARGPQPARLRPDPLPPRPVPPPVTDAEDPELAAYNRYLAQLHGDRA